MLGAVPTVNFFQASATVIPTLMIALVFAARSFEWPFSDSEKEDPLLPVVKLTWAGLTIGFIVAVVQGEMAALEALSTGPSAGLASRARFAIGFELFFIGMNVLSPVLFGLLEPMRPRKTAYAALVTMGGYGILFLLLWLLS